MLKGAEGAPSEDDRMAGGLPQPVAASGFRSETRGEKNQVYCKIIQKSHCSSSFHTLQSTVQGQHPSLETVYCITWHFKNSVGTNEVHVSFPWRVRG